MRQPKPFYREQTKSWYVQIGKKQHNLGRDKADALALYHRLMADGQELTEETLVAVLILRFLEAAKVKNAPSSFEMFKRHCGSFADFVGNRLLISRLKNAHVNDWLDAEYPQPRCSNNYRLIAIKCVMRALNWAVKQGHIEKSPIANFEKPAYTPRDAILTPEQWAQLVAAVKACGKRGEGFLDFITIMRQTGCRPQEARAAEARHFLPKERCLVFERSESKGYGGRNTTERRVVPLTDEAFAICERLAAKYPTGPLLRNSRGTPWTKGTIKLCFWRLDGRASGCKAKIPFRTSAYVIRHTWATEALANGVSPIHVATIMGHTSLEQLMKTYQHLNKKGDALRAALNQAVNGAVATAT